MVPKVLASPSTGLTVDLKKGQRADPLIRASRPPKAPKFSNTSKPTTDLGELHDYWSKRESEAKKPSILAITNPKFRTEVHVKPDAEFDPVDELIEREDAEFEQPAKHLLEWGERDLDTIVTLKGIQLNIKRNPPPKYLSSQGVLKRQAERYRYRNQEASRRERLVNDALFKSF